MLFVNIKNILTFYLFSFKIYLTDIKYEKEPLMKRNALKIISITVCVVMLAAMLASLVPAYAVGTDGLTFTSTTSYACDKNTSSIKTFEAVLSLPESVTGRGGVILGNYANSACVSFEIDANGVPRIFANPVLGNASDTNFRFYNVHVNTGEKVHLAIVRDGGSVTCYVNGKVAETLTDNYSYEFMMEGLALGGDLRPENEQYFKGTLYSATMFSDARTSSEIEADASGALANTDSLIAHYDLTSVSKRDVIPDESGNGYHMTCRYGLSFDADSLYDTKKQIVESPKTFEATVFFPDNTSGSLDAGIILGNHPKDGNISFELTGNGLPRLYTAGADYVFGGSGDGYTVNLFTGKPEHIAIVIDESAGKVFCYHNGNLLGSGETYVAPTKYNTEGMVLGGDLRLTNDQYFKGRILNAAMFSDARSQSEIASDMNSMPTDASLIAWYDMSEMTSASTVTDKSGNGYDMTRRMLWMDETKERVLGRDYAYSFAVIGDTQIIARDQVDGKFSGYFEKIYDYVVANKESKNIQFVFGLGDITDTFSWYADASTHAPLEWELAMTNMKKMDGVVPYSIVRGNHDEVDNYNKYVKYDDYKNVLAGSFEENMLNTYQTLDVGEVKYLIFSLDYGPSDAVLDWASDVIEANPNRNVIITTHSYLFRDGTTLDDGDECPPSADPISIGKNDGDDMWEKLIKKHENIVLVMSGHDPSATIVRTQTKGDHGNTVTQLLIDPQNLDKDLKPMGMVAMMYFSEDGKSVDVEWYSTIQERFYREENVFSLSLDTVDVDENTGDGDGDDDGDAPSDESNPSTPSTPSKKPSTSTTPDEGTPQDTTDAQDTDDVEETDEEKSGCGSAVSASVLTVAIIPAACCLVKRKRKN